MTRAELSKFTIGPVYVALCGVIYDVTLADMETYGPTGLLKQFAGRDATYALACHSFDPDTISKKLASLKELSETQLNTLNDWKATFEAKYGVVGKLLD
jgi:hypothetical protein